MLRTIAVFILIVVIAMTVLHLYNQNTPQVKGRGLLQQSEAFYVSGYVVHKGLSDDAWSGLKLDALLEDGALLKTSKESSVEIKFGKDMKNIVSAQEETLIELDKIACSGDKNIVLKKGRIISDINALESESKFEVRTPTAVCGVLGTSFETIADQDKTTVKVYEGQVYVTGTGIQSIFGKEVLVREGSQTDVYKSRSPESPRPLEADDTKQWQEWRGNITQRMFRDFYVFADEDDIRNNYYPSGWVGDYDAIRRLSWEDNAHAGKNCLRFKYTGRTPQGAGWAGVHWQNPVNNWGDVEGGLDLTGASRLSFWARGEKGGETIVRLGIGGVGGEYPDSCKVEIGPIVLTKDWKEYKIDLSNKDLSFISCGFYWMTDRNSNPDGAVFYIDEIKYE
jgi:hypothetical protein